MELYTRVKLKENFKNHNKGTIGIVIEIYENSVAYLEILDDKGDTVEIIYDVPPELLESIN